MSSQVMMEAAHAAAGKDPALVRSAAHLHAGLAAEPAAPFLQVLTAAQRTGGGKADVRSVDAPEKRETAPVAPKARRAEKARAGADDDGKGTRTGGGDRTAPARPDDVEPEDDRTPPDPKAESRVGDDAGDDAAPVEDPGDDDPAAGEQPAGADHAGGTVKREAARVVLPGLQKSPSAAVSPHGKVQPQAIPALVVDEGATPAEPEDALARPADGATALGDPGVTPAAQAAVSLLRGTVHDQEPIAAAAPALHEEHAPASPVAARAAPAGGSLAAPDGTGDLSTIEAAKPDVAAPRVEVKAALAGAAPAEGGAPGAGDPPPPGAPEDGHPTGGSNDPGAAWAARATPAGSSLTAALKSSAGKPAGAPAPATFLASLAARSAQLHVREAVAGPAEPAPAPPAAASPGADDAAVGPAVVQEVRAADRQGAEAAGRPATLDLSEGQDRWTGKLATAIRSQIRAGGSQLRMVLKPPRLGEMELKLQVRGPAVRLSIDVESNSARHLLSAGSADLRDSLKDAGLQLERMHITVNEKEGRSGKDSRPDPETGGRRRPRGDVSGELQLAGAVPAEAASSADNLINFQA